MVPGSNYRCGYACTCEFPVSIYRQWEALLVAAMTSGVTGPSRRSNGLPVGRRSVGVDVVDRSRHGPGCAAEANPGNAIGIPEVKFGTVLHADDIVAIPSVSYACGCSSMVEPQPSKLMVRVRFPSPAPMRGLSAILGRRVPSIGSRQRSRWTETGCSAAW